MKGVNTIFVYINVRFEMDVWRSYEGSVVQLSFILSKKLKNEKKREESVEPLAWTTSA